MGQPTVNVYILDLRTMPLVLQSNHVQRRGKLTCWLCGETLCRGDRVVSRGAAGHRKFYHYECARKVQLI